MSAINPISFKEPYRPNGAQICPVPIDVCIDGYAAIFTLERFQAKWRPVRVKKTRQIKNLEPRFDSIETEKALGSRAPPLAWRLPFTSALIDDDTNPEREL